MLSKLVILVFISSCLVIPNMVVARRGCVIEVGEEQSTACARIMGTQGSGGKPKENTNSGYDYTRDWHGPSGGQKEIENLNNSGDSNSSGGK